MRGLGSNTNTSKLGSATSGFMQGYEKMNSIALQQQEMRQKEEIYQLQKQRLQLEIQELQRRKTTNKGVQSSQLPKQNQKVESDKQKAREITSKLQNSLDSIQRIWPHAASEARSIDHNCALKMQAVIKTEDGSAKKHAEAERTAKLNRSTS